MDLGEIDWWCGVDSIGSEQGSAAVCCECGDEPLGFGTIQLVIDITSGVLKMLYGVFNSFHSKQIMDFHIHRKIIAVSCDFTVDAFD